MDVTPEGLPTTVPTPWGHELRRAWTDQHVGRVLDVRAGHRLSVQLHEHEDETSFVLAGRLELLKGPSADAPVATEVGPDGRWRARPDAVEAIEDADGLELFAPHPDDVVRRTDSSVRKGTSAP